MSIYTDKCHQLCCPLCGETNVHVDEARIAARPAEDGEVIQISVNKSGEIGSELVPVGDRVGSGRRHRIALHGWCEMCAGKFAFVFTQHKGVTLVEPQEIDPVTPVQLDSEAERRVWDAHVQMNLQQLSGLVTQHDLIRYRLDFALPDQRIGFEVDGYAYHSDKKTFEKDRKRHRELELAGWRIVRFTGKEACETPERVVLEMAKAVTAFAEMRVPEQGGPASIEDRQPSEDGPSAGESA
jgi:very-short-patch-repair endonuclease